MNISQKKILVTGADGFIGSHLVEHLVAAGASVTALAMYNSFDQAGWLDDLPAETLERMRVVRGDIRDDAMVRRLVDRQDIVLHLAALIAIPFSYDAPRAYIDTNIIGTLNVLEAARAAGNVRVVQTSTSEVYGTAIRTPIDEAHPLQGQSPYSASKIGADMLAESYARSFGLNVVILRPFNTFGPRQSERAVIPTIIRQALDPACTEIRLGDLTPRRDLTFVADTAAAFALAATASKLEPGAAYNAGRGSAISIGDLAKKIVALTGCKKPIVSENARLRPEKSEVRELLADSTLFSSLTTWQAMVSLDEGLERTIAWWKPRLAAGKVRRSVGYAT